MHCTYLHFSKALAYKHHGKDRSLPPAQRDSVPMLAQKCLLSTGALPLLSSHIFFCCARGSGMPFFLGVCFCGRLREMSFPFPWSPISYVPDCPSHEAEDSKGKHWPDLLFWPQLVPSPSALLPAFAFPTPLVRIKATAPFASLKQWIGLWNQWKCWVKHKNLTCPCNPTCHPRSSGAYPARGGNLIQCNLMYCVCLR